MDLLINTTAQNLTNNVETLILSPRQLSLSTVISWLFSRLRIFLYLSNPYEESFEFEHQVADYHTEVS